jgi:exodeoxyribonuclease V alpha subunit
MKPPRVNDTPIYQLTGQIERITFANEENGYTIAKVRIPDRKELVTIVGTLMTPMPGEIIEMKGRWSEHPRFGEQFRIVEYSSKVPATIYGIKKYLGSGLIPGLGPKIAERIVSYFGDETLDVIEGDLPRLRTVPGVGKKRIEKIKNAWDEQREIRKVMLFLQSHGVSSGYAAKIFKHYGKNAIFVVTQNPYRMATDIYGIGFVTADGIAAKIGIEKDDPLRVAAGILYVLNQLADEGHVYFPYEPLVQKCKEILFVERKVVVAAMGTIVMEERIVIEDLNEDLDNFIANHKAVYLSSFHLCETRISSKLSALLSACRTLKIKDPLRTITWVQKHLSFKLAPRQIHAVKLSLTHKVLVLTGGPGTGKTTILNSILKIFQRFNVDCLLAAPTGRAAKRMAETTGYPAKTIHRLLEYSFAKGGFQKNGENLLACELLIIDEASMIDTLLFHHLLKAVPLNAVLILVGDIHQLPSVGPGNVLVDIIKSRMVPVVELNQIFRQAKQSRIIINAHRINQGILPSKTSFAEKAEQSDFFFIEQDDPERVLNIIITLVTERIPKRFGLKPLEDIQVLAPMHRGIVGAGNLNRRLQAVLNQRDQEIHRGDQILRVGDRIMQIRNNYDREVFNGDMGRILQFNWEEKQVLADFEGHKVVYDFADLDEIVLAYAVSVHKSQGSEYPAVIIPILTQHYILLQRNLIYTAVTRGRRLVVLVGSRKALAIAVKNNKTEKRHTYLRHRLRDESVLRIRRGHQGK